MLEVNSFYVLELFLRYERTYLAVLRPRGLKIARDDTCLLGSRKKIKKIALVHTDISYISARSVSRISMLPPVRVHLQTVRFLVPCLQQAQG